VSAAQRLPAPNTVVMAMPKSGASIHFCLGCEARGVETPVRAGRTLCPQCLAARAAQAGPGGAEVSLDDPRLTQDEAREIMRMRSDENRLVQTAICAFTGALAGPLLVYCVTHRRYGPPMLSGHPLLVAMLAAGVVGAVAGGIWGFNRPPWKWAR
jgi:hypothetical protein